MDLGSRSRGIGSWGPLDGPEDRCYAGMASEAAVGPLWGLFSGDIRPHPSHGWHVWVRGSRDAVWMVGVKMGSIDLRGHEIWMRS
jgi:hypothetical protein